MANAKAPVDWSSGMDEQNNAGCDNGWRFIVVTSPPLDGICDGDEVETIDMLRLAWGLVLGMYTGASDISFGCIRRESASNESPVKEWVHRMVIDRSTPMMELLKQSSSSKLHQNGGLEDVASPKISFGGCDTVLMLDVDSGGAAKVLWRPDMTNVNIVLVVDGTTMSLGYRISKLGSLQARSMAAAMGRIISTLIDRPLTPMRDFDMCDDKDMNILTEWNNVETTWKEQCVHDLFAKQVADYADNVAVDAWDGQLTYRELDRLSSNLAEHLMDLGVKPETFVALCFEKSKWLVVSILAVIKAGGAYVVIEPYYPLARMTDICTQLEIDIMLASPDLLHLANKLSNQAVAVEPGSEYLDHGQGARKQRKRTTPSNPRNALYVVFSSGSTGKPKGIVVEHAAFVSWGTTLRQSLCLGSHSRVLQFSSFAFLIAHRDVLLTLMFGGCVCVPSESQRLNHLETFITDHGVNWANLTPSVAALLNPEMATGLQTLLLTSEPMSLSSLTTWDGKVKLLFAYGQGESVSLCCVNTSPTAGSDRKNVGHRVGRRVWLVDPDNHNKLVPVGAIGELVIQGPILARGYLDSERTALAFLDDAPWLQKLQPGYSGRLYKTGDLAQFADDGSVRYISRKDNSVKLYGQRLDLDEVVRHIENCLTEMSDTAVSNVVVDLFPVPHSNDVKLTAFLGLDSTSPDTSNTLLLGPLDQASVYLREFRFRLADVVPRYMIPALVVPVSRIPLNLSGKIDRRQLRDMLSLMTDAELASCMESNVSHEAPCTAQERQLRTLWSQVLHTAESSIGRLDDFFRRGGDSLAAMKLVSLAHAAGFALRFGDVFAHPRLSSQAHLVDSAAPSRAQDDYCCAPFGLITESRKQIILAVAAEKYELSESQVEDIYPTTPMQEGLIALNDLQPGSYVSQRVYKIANDVSLCSLEAAWKRTMDANPPLRTRLVRCSDNGSTYQLVVRNQMAIDMNHDLNDYRTKDAAKPMNLGTPLVRISITCNAQKAPNFCVVTMHHCIYDAWSMSLLLRQVRDAYHGSIPSPQTFRQFVNYVQQASHDSAEYWKAELADIHAEPFPALPSQSHSPSTAESEMLSTRLPRSGASTANTTLATCIQLAWAVTVASYTGINDVVFGLTVSGRASPVPRIDKMAGPTIATFPLRVKLQSNASIREELQALQNRVLSTIPFEHFGLQNIRRLGDDAAKACKFQSLLVIQQNQSLSEEKCEIFSATTEGLIVRPTWDTYALSILCSPAAVDGNIQFEAVYDAAVVPKAQTRRILQVFANILKQTVSSPDMVVADINGISTEDMQQIQAWNNSVSPTVMKCIHDMIHEHVVSRPEATAIDAWDGQLTYKDLDEQSSLLSGILAGHGLLRQETFVPLCLAKSKWVAVAILAVIKAGGALILLDSSHPTERLAWICRNAQAPIVLCAKDTAGLAAQLGCKLVIQVDASNNTQEKALSAVSTGVHHQPSSRRQTRPGNAVCAIYTSGSTGAPKGVVIEHSALATQISSLGPLYDLNHQSRIFQFASHAFDVAVSDYLFGLATGACICVPQEADSRDNLAGAMRGCRANWAFLTPSVARTLSPYHVPNLGVLVTGGESARAADFRIWSGALRLLYVYGPAECTIYSTVQTVSQPTANPANVGRGVTGACWLVEANNPEKLVAIGAVGELLVQGPLVGRCYLGEESLSSSSFIPYPKWLQALRGGHAVNRLYRTGDMFRYSPIGDGSLEFVGRKDSQVKLHGQRMELAEIEHHVAQSFPTAADSIVEIITPLGSTDQKILAAFIWDATTSSSSSAGKHSVQSHSTLDEPSLFAEQDEVFKSRISSAEAKLQKTLPRFMIPSLWIPLARFPLSPNGKANRRLIQGQACLLSRQQLGVYQSCFGPSNKRLPRPPSTESEGRIHQLVADVLGLSGTDVGMNDNFFQLGGDSIKAMIMSTRAADMDLRLAAADILAYPRLCDMAAEVAVSASANKKPCSSFEQRAPPPPFSLLPPEHNHDELLQEISEQCKVDKDCIEDVYPCTPLQEGLFALTIKQPSAYVLRFTLQLTQDVDVDRFKNAWDTVMTNNPILRTRIVCATSLGGSLVQAVMCNKASYEQPIDTTSRYTVGLGKPLFNIQLWPPDKDVDRCKAVVTIHHALYDGVSLRLLLKQLSAAYYQRKETTRTWPYNCFIQYCLSQPPDDQVKRFWAAELADAAGSVFTTAAPIMMDSYFLQSPRHAESRVSLAVSDAQSNVPLSAALKLAWGVVVSSFTGQGDAVFGTVVSGRMANVKGIDRMAGPTIATVPFRIRHAPAMTIQQALDDVQSQSVEMIRFEQTGLQRIRQLGFADACRFQSLLMIQFAEQENIPASPLYTLVQDKSADTFHTYPLTIECSPSSGGSVHLRATFDSDVVPAKLVSRLLTQYSLALVHITAKPWEPLSSIPLQCPEDATRVWAWNEIVPRRKDTCVHEIISSNLAKRRGYSAVCASDGELTYQELEDKSARLAGHLTSLGVGPGKMVPLCFEKSKWAIVATLAVLKAGGAFVPLDTSQAAGRRETILACVRAEVILTSSKYATTLASTDRLVFSVCDASLKELQLPLVTPALHGLDSSAAYVLFTSGSTGQPKGVVVDHGALSTSCLFHGSEMGFNEKTRALQFTSFTFDISLMEIFTTLLYGGCICIPSDADRFNNLELSASSMEVNTVSLTASVARLVEPDRMRSLETIIFVGEDATDDDFKKWRHLPHIFNAYGPTECTIFCSINKVQVGSNSSSNIGKAVGSVCWVVSPQDHCRLVPIGAVGELLVEGPVLARGYLNDSEKTLASFIEDPPWLVKGIAGCAGRRGRLYKTGDLVRYNEDGSLTYCGRKDTQVKIRGHRVELGEVECQIRDCIAGVNHAVVMALPQDGRNASPVLTAFLCFDYGDNSSDIQSRIVSIPLSARDALADRLPVYMIPSIFLAVGRLPLNTSGKLDRSRLRDIFSSHFQGQRVKGNVTLQGLQQQQQNRQPEQEQKVELQHGQPTAAGASSLAASSSPFRDCANETERRIRVAWATVLGIRSDMIGIDDNFYDLGGDSIRIISLVRLIQNEFDVWLGQSLVNSRNTTISKIADYVDNNNNNRFDVGGSTFDLEEKMGDALSSNWAAATSQPWFSPTKSVRAPAIIFLTGGTGFLGTQILHRLLSSDVVARVVALVRATSAAHGLERLRQSAVTAGWWKAEYEARITVWTGDLQLAQLGLSGSQWAQLSGTATVDNVTAVIHNGAVVNWHMDYDSLQSANVSATIELLKATALSRSSPRFVFVSGGVMADLDTSPGNTVVAEQLSRSNGYSQSKFVAETIVRRFVSQLPSSQDRFSVIKPGMIIGTAEKGVANVDDFIWRVVATASRLQLFPLDAKESWVPVSDAAFVALQTVAQILSDDISPYVNIATTFGLGSFDFWQQVNSELNCACEPVSWSVWVERAFEDINRGGQDHPLWPVQDVLKGRNSSGISVSSPLSPPDKQMLCKAVRANVRHLGRVGFL
ncbi:hypothetical protein NHJ13051_005282 [Beauveria bassiana]